MPEPPQPRRLPRYPVQIPLVYWKEADPHQRGAGWTYNLCEHGVGVELDGILYTPPVRCGLLPGTYRGWMLGRKRVRERELTVETVLRSRDVYLMNSVRGMWRVKVVE